jgi:hypothetical protein
MRNLLTIGLAGGLAAAAFAAAPPVMAKSQPVLAQPAVPQPDAQGADAANADSMPDQGTDAVLAAPAIEPRAYPLCSRTVTDSCINPREAGRRHGNTPLPYWPGRPASEMR